MPLRRMLQHTAVVRPFIRNESSRNKYGEPQESYGSPQSFPAFLDDMQTEDLRVFLPAEAFGQIKEQDRVDVDGQPYEVSRPPLVRRTPQGVHHLEVPVKYPEWVKFNG